MPTKDEIKHRLELTSLVSLVDDVTNEIIFAEKQLNKMIHSVIWTMRGKFNPNNVKISIRVILLDSGIGGNPKDEVSFYNLVETISVIAVDNNNRIISENEMFVEFTPVGDLTMFNSLHYFNYDKKDFVCSENFSVLFNKLVKPKLNYFNGLELFVNTML